jgi:L-lactate dehydrogenase complex protein LldG
MKTKDLNDINREKILSRLKKHVEGADYEKLPEESNYIYPDLSHNKSVTQFINLLEMNHAQVVKVTTETITTVIKDQLEQRNINTLLYGVGGEYASLIEADFSSEISYQIELQKYDFDLKENKERLFEDCPASITGSKYSIAHTGTIVLWPSSQEPRTMSLVPPVHFVIVDANKMVSNFATLIEEEKWRDNLPTNVLLISGPSKTADIQQTLAYGAHGPKELIVLLINS